MNQLATKIGLCVLAFATAATLSTSALASHHGDKPDRGDRDMFERVDSNDDGFISAEEHAAGIAKMTKKMNQRFADMDADNDGKVSKDEARDHHKAMRDERRERRDEWRDKRD